MNDRIEDLINGLSGHVPLLDSLMRVSANDVIYLVPFLLVAVGLLLAYATQASASTTKCRVPETSASGKVHLRLDSDCDGLSNRAERKIWGTNPRDADTDDDGLNDGEEVQQTLTCPAPPLSERVVRRRVQARGPE